MTLQLKKKKYLDYINPKIIMSYGVDFAKLVMIAYFSESAQDKLESTHQIYRYSGVKEEVKVKFIGDVMVKPKTRRHAIALQLEELIKDAEKASNIEKVCCMI